LERLKLVLHEASEDSDLQNDSAIFPFFALTTLTHPQSHPNFTNEYAPHTSVFVTNGNNNKDTANNSWETKLREELRTFCEFRLPLITPPRLVTLFQAFNKWETSLAQHAAKNKEIALSFREQR